ncbi:MAG: leucine-rich repeat protein [Clostridia bacterium]|nr:leucine-rich repeat protein [Clostridia bacterium]
MKRVLSAVLALVMVFVLVGVVGASADTQSGTTGDCTWILDGTTLTISGEGAMEDYNIEIFGTGAKSDSPWYNSDIQKVIISEGVTAIGDGAFAKCNQLATAEIASTVISIGKGTFANTNLKNINIPKSIKEIDYAAFLLTNSAQEWIELLENVFYVGDETDKSKLFINNADGFNDSIVHATWKYVAFETLIKTDGENWNYYVNGIKRDHTTLVKYKNKWFYVENGVWKKTANTLVKHSGKWFYVTNGVWDKTVTDKVVTYKNKSFYIKNGKWDSSVNTLTKKNGEWLGIVNGKWDTSAKTLIKYKGNWFYVKNGEWCKKTAIVKYKGKRFYVKNGKVDFDYSGKKKIDGKTYKIKNGKVA